jgi:uncharacterized protein
MKEYSLYNEEPVIRTATGKWFNVFSPTSDMICIEDIAHALAHQCRFGGHLPKFYSVAQHSVLTAVLVAPENKLAALMHDASEAYLIDVPRPIKNKLANYKEIEGSVMTLIAAKFGFQWPLHDEVKRADETMLQKEWDEIMMSCGNPSCYSPQEAKAKFLTQFEIYYDKARIF